MAKKINRQHMGRVAVTAKLNEVIEQVNPIIDIQGRKGITIKKTENRWVIEVNSAELDLDFSTVTEQRCVNGSLVERTYLLA